MMKDGIRYQMRRMQVVVGGGRGTAYEGMDDWSSNAGFVCEITGVA